MSDGLREALAAAKIETAAAGAEFLEGLVAIGEPVESQEIGFAVAGGASGMSLDYPFYEELRRRRHAGAWWWLIGDRLYYFGLLPATAAVPGAGMGPVAGLFGFGWRWLASAAVVFAAGVVVFFIGVALKGHAYALAERDGITSDGIDRGGS